MGSLLLLLTVGAVLVGVMQLTVAPVSGWIVLWVLLPVLGVPASLYLAYQLYCLATSRYRLDRNGFYMQWGVLVEEIPLAEIRGVHSHADLESTLRPRAGFRWPGYLVAELTLDDGMHVEFYATTGPVGWVILELEDRYLVISPPDPTSFAGAFLDATRMGSLEPVRAKTRRPDFLFGRIWSDVLARALLVAGLALPLLLLGYLAFRISSLPSQVPFGFRLDGSPALMVPPSRLLLLPMIGGLCWLLDGLVGVWLYRRGASRLLSYIAWGVATLIGALLWGAALQLLAVA